MKGSSLEEYAFILGTTTLSDTDQIKVIKLIDQGNKHLEKVVMLIFNDASNKDKYQLVIETLLVLDEKFHEYIVSLTTSALLISDKTGKFELAIRHMVTCPNENRAWLQKIALDEALIADKGEKYQVAIRTMSSFDDEGIKDEVYSGLMYLAKHRAKYNPTVAYLLEIAEYRDLLMLLLTSSNLIKDETGKYEFAINVYLTAEYKRVQETFNVLTNRHLIKKSNEDYENALLCLTQAPYENVPEISGYLTDYSLLSAKGDKYKLALEYLPHLSDNPLLRYVITNRKVLRLSSLKYQQALEETKRQESEIDPEKLSVDDYRSLKGNAKPPLVKRRRGRKGNIK